MEGHYRWRGNFTLEGASKRRSKKCYECLQLPDLTNIRTGDAVIIENHDGEDFIALVQCLYDSGEAINNKRAIVEWYMRKQELSALAELRMPTVAHKRELFLFKKPKSSLVETDIDAETIIGKCLVDRIHTDDALPAKSSHSGLPYYFVRWAYDSSNFSPVFPDGIADARSMVKMPKPEGLNWRIMDVKRDDGEDSDGGSTTSKDSNRTPARKKTINKLKLTRSEPPGKMKKFPGRVSSNLSKMDVEEALELFFSSGDEYTPTRKTKSKNTFTNSSSRRSMVKNLHFREDDICDLDMDMTIYDTVKGRNKFELQSRFTPRKSPNDGKVQKVPKLKISRTPLTTSKLPQARKEEGTPARRRSVRLSVPQSCPHPRREQSNKGVKDTEGSTKRRSRRLVYEEDVDSESSSEKENVRQESQKSKRRSVNDRNLTTPKTTSKVMTTKRVDTPRVGAGKDKVTQSCPPSRLSGRRSTTQKTSKRCINFAAIKEEDEDLWESGSGSSDEFEEYEPKRRRPSKPAAKRKVHATPKTKSSARDATPQIHARKTPRKTPSQPLEQARVRLHVSAVPSSLPCREDEFADIFSFVKGHLLDKLWGCLYVSGVPGTGKTATVHAMLEELNTEVQDGSLPPFQTIEINGMRLTEPHQAFVQILKHLTGQKATPQHAATILEQHFTSSRPKSKPVVLIVDELDLLWTRKQDVLYSIFDWPTKPKSGLIVVAIANTMDLPERIMMNRVSSRLGLSRMTFQPYTFKQLQEIVEVRLHGLRAFDSEAIQLAARKVAALSGDARRALDICRRATEIAEASQKKGSKGTVGLGHVEQAVSEMFCSPKIMAIRSASKQEQIFMRALISEFRQTGLEETTFEEVLKQHVSLCRLQGFTPPSVSEVWAVCVRLAASKLLLLEAGFNEIGKRILLNVSQDDVRFALSQSES